jgi:outer membrane receptor protein involved in Fe transport
LRFLAIHRHVATLITFLLSAVASAQETERLVVQADRLPDVEADAPFSVEVITKDELSNAPQLRLDDILRNEVPGFSLFRRNSSRVANPTTQGVTLRNFGPSGAGRTLVLFDGIPINDPFAGYVSWNQVPPDALDNVLVTPGGGAGLFGNAALAGTIFLVSRMPSENSAAANLSLGNENTYDTSLFGAVVHGPVSVAVFADRFSTSGYPVIRENQRGPIDNNASADSTLFRVDSEIQLDATTSLRLSGDRFHEERGNGTIYTENGTDGTDLSAVFKKQFPATEAQLALTAYLQWRSYHSTFSSVNDARTVETPALDQFHVPANAAGGSAVWSMALPAQHRITLGGDFRWVEGETNEWFRFISGEFTRLRIAGGDELFAGAFAEDTWTPNERLTITSSARFDYWQLYDGFRHEFDRASAAPTLLSDFSDRDGEEVNGRLGARFSLTSSFAVRAAGYTGFRVPTLNELYRPFRVGNDVTDSNAALNPEHLLGCEAGFEWRPASSLTFSATGFYDHLEDAIGNVTISATSAGALRQRQNLDLVTAPGVELAAEWRPMTSLRFKGSYIFTDPRVDRATDASLVGNLLAQTPQHVVVLAAEWKPTTKWLFSVQARYVDQQFEDDQNSRVLAPFTTVDLAVGYEFSQNISAAVKIENLLDQEIETGKSADGLVSIGAPRLVTLQLRVQL